jgi:hypothetical protein
MSRRLILWIVAAFAVLGLMLVLAMRGWMGPEMGVSGHGMFAFILGAVLTLAVSMGLFLLVFHSARHGHDDIDPPPGS